MRVVNFLLAIMFLAFAFLQVNDPDPVLWILIYGAMAIICIMAIFEYYSRKFLYVFTAILLIYSMTFVPGVVEWWNQPDRSVLFDDLTKMEYPYIEESREFLGLGICILVAAFYLFRSHRKR
jgi:glucan phosphoethanolaminetransferase (alkaline phosphatase superfamily)